MAGVSTLEAASEDAAAVPTPPVAIASSNGMKATAKAMEILKGGGKPPDAVVAA